MIVIKICLSLAIWLTFSEFTFEGMRKLCEPDVRHHSLPLPYVLNVGFLWFLLPILGSFIMSFLVWGLIPQ